jgi:hypothetical protein
MKFEEATNTVAHFFNDLIGSLVPGVVLAVGLALMHLGPAQLRSVFEMGDTTLAALTFAGVLFAVGHALLALHEHGLRRLLSAIGLHLGFDEAAARQRQSFIWFSALVGAHRAQAAPENWSYNDLRSVALSVSIEAASIGRRFMFISLLCNGVGTALLIVALDLAVCSCLLPELLYAYDLAAPWPVQALLLLGVSAALLENGRVFYARAMATPFAIAVAELNFKKDSNAGESTKIA